VEQGPGGGGDISHLILSDLLCLGAEHLSVETIDKPETVFWKTVRMTKEGKSRHCSNQATLCVSQG
jgi:hypothetical protein